MRCESSGVGERRHYAWSMSRNGHCLLRLCEHHTHPLSAPSPSVQLAVITPYAQFSLHYVCRSGATADAIRTRAAGDGGGRSDFSFVWRRRSAQVPRPPSEVRARALFSYGGGRGAPGPQLPYAQLLDAMRSSLDAITSTPHLLRTRQVRHHPSSVNDLLVRSLMDVAKKPKQAAAGGGGGATLQSFLSTSFSCIDRPLAARLIAELGPGFEASTDVSTLDAKAVHQVRVWLASNREHWVIVSSLA